MIIIKKILSSILSLKTVKVTTLAVIAACLMYFSSFQGTVTTSLPKESNFFKALGHMESSSKYDKVNQFGYLGKYQFGEDTLYRLGYYLKDGSRKNDWKGQWTGKSGVFSKEDFMTNYQAQERAVHELTAANWNVAKVYKLDKVIGQIKHGVYVTREGILAAMHLKGPSSVADFIFYGVDSKDGLGTSVKRYMNLFANCEKLATV